MHHLLSHYSRIFYYTAVLYLSIVNIVQAEDARIYPIEAKKAGILVQSMIERQAPTLVFMYASWCAVCRENFPILLDIARKYKEAELNIVAFSLDRDKSDLGRYLAIHGNIPFTPYFVLQRYPGEFIEVMNRVGIHYRNAIPYSVLYSKKGVMVGQGSFLVTSLAPVIDELVNDNSAYNKSQEKQ